MSDIAIKVEGLSKRYRLGEGGEGIYSYKSFREEVSNLLAAPFRWMRTQAGPPGSGISPAPSGGNFIWALRDVSFTVRRGAVIGIIGRNGAGKTTLLKILSRITEPTEGCAEISGRVRSLLEVGTGFHPELTGRENIYLNGAIMGMKKVEINSKFDEIVDFAEIEQFLDTPVKRYSSGMYVRLAFSVAAHLEPEILLVDEVLAVGDAVFQKKCLGKMGDVARGGRTVLFVSHNMLAIRGMSQKCILLHQGRIEDEGEVNRVIEHYFSTGLGDMPNEIDTSKWNRPEGLGTDLKVTRVSLPSSTGRARIPAGGSLTVKMEMEVARPVEEIVYGFSVFTSSGIRLFQCHNTNEGLPYPRLEPGRYHCEGIVDNINLPPGLYNLDIGVRCNSKGLDWLRDLMFFEVTEPETTISPWFKAQDGLFRQSSRWNLSRVGGD